MITAFLPCRAGSQRVPLKNTRPFAGVQDGLLGIKLQQLLECDAVDRIVLSTNDDVVIEIAARLAGNDARLAIDVRPDELCTSETSTDDLIAYVPSVIRSGDILWTHVTSPMVTSGDYSAMIEAYRAGLTRGSSDSLMAVTPIQQFLWSTSGPLNYDREIERWPRTQTLEKIYAVNSAAFILNQHLMAGLKDRVGARPLYFELDEWTAFDVDWPQQFNIAETLYTARTSQETRR
jgi:CMP-N-acetylneuraminic acid synthetase